MRGPDLIGKIASAEAGPGPAKRYPACMSAIYIPSAGPDSWRQFLAQPERQWVSGYSARTLAHSWEAANGLPAEVRAALEMVVTAPRLLLALPEHKTALPGGRRESQSDVFALIRSDEHLIAATIEGKVDEPFGPTVAEWLQDASPGKRTRLEAVCGLLGLSAEPDGAVRYQLLHRTAAAVIEAERFAAGAAMIVHSFSPDARWHADYGRFTGLLGAVAAAGSAARVQLPSGKPLYLAWVPGDQRFRSA